MSDIFAGLENSDLNADTAATESPSLNGLFNSAQTARRFMSAGHATVTLKSRATGNRFTYSIRAARDRETGQRTGDGTLFVGVLSGPDNARDYGYLGRISRDVFWHGRRTAKPSDIRADAPSAKAFAWAWQKLATGTMPEKLEVWHEGCCGRCGRKLTVPESISSGFGPECIKHQGE
jgi:hypothetical protein